MYHVNAENLPGNEVSRTFEGGSHDPWAGSPILWPVLVGTRNFGEMIFRAMLGPAYSV